MGDLGTTWLAELPEIVRAVAERWDLRIGDVYEGGTASLVVAANASDDTACVLKVAMPFDDAAFDTFDRAVYVHQVADGRGCPRLLRHDVEPRALLLERLGPNLDRLGFGVPDILTTVADTLREFWRPVASDAPLPTGADQARALGEFITSAWDELGRPCPRIVVDRALDLCQSRIDAFERSDAVLVHGDAHGWNTLQADEHGYKLVDPEGLISDRAHDLGVPMREYNEPLLQGDTVALTRARANELAERCGADEQAVWEWGFIERVSTGLANLLDFEEGGDEFLEVAQRCS
ncbi:MAG: aminoglycoside phosphotransferase family protein [Ilumatobacter sp.]|uniref:aminoglycoside phosphotransferase family protein n=1 Tax=Ilumatobacter sp. TaxID=1967498 RepID=UPI00262B0C1B|nr:aminoglycoside phosphotransferase family protein [Ilumatobacter sp.]MDJ0767287.1 aminoglycoside phosphotransferase family protein [Ilumatobacter sp.]